MARRKRHRVRHSRKRPAYGKCMSGVLRGRKLKTKKQRRTAMKAVQRKCGKYKR